MTNVDDHLEPAAEHSTIATSHLSPSSSATASDAQLQSVNSPMSQAPHSSASLSAFQQLPPPTVDVILRLTRDEAATRTTSAPRGPKASFLTGVTGHWLLFFGLTAAVVGVLVTLLGFTLLSYSEVTFGFVLLIGACVLMIAGALRIHRKVSHRRQCCRRSVNAPNSAASVGRVVSEPAWYWAPTGGAVSPTDPPPEYCPAIVLRPPSYDEATGHGISAATAPTRLEAKDNNEQQQQQQVGSDLTTSGHAETENGNDETVETDVAIAIQTDDDESSEDKQKGNSENI